MTTTKKQSLNKLAEEKSPYLLQHADNPVNWYPWGREAFQLAKSEDKPIFLSIGYSTCHWCHVMAHESFEDEEVAELINNSFIPIKVDREERPDIDNIYMKVCQMMTGRGGWPLTIFMTADRKPFYAATYLPKESRYGRSGLKELIPEINKLWNNKRDELLDSANKITETLKQKTNEKADKLLTEDIFHDVTQQLKREFDSKYGGFGNAPKFPIPHQNLFLLSYFYHFDEELALEMVEKTLKSMRCGGIYDHLGSGFHRYSTDRKWLLPHFEKMLYDQALLIYLYTVAYQITGDKIYKKTVEDVINYLNSKMLSHKGGFFSAEDADSEGEEGKYYIWRFNEIEDVLSEENARKIIELYNIKPEGNFREERSGKLTGKNIMYLLNETGIKREYELVKERNKLYNQREKRVKPDTDDKILTDWNGLLIASLARAAFVFNNNSYLELAENVVNFIDEELFKEGILLHRYRKGEAAISGIIDDYTFLTWGLLELYQSSFKVSYLKRAVNLQEQLLENFWDENEGGFYYTSLEMSDLIIRSKEVYDGAVPSGNSVALMNLVKLSHLTGNHLYEEKAEELVKTFANQVKQNPVSYSLFLLGLENILLPYYDLIIVGEKEDKGVKEILDFLKENYRPNVSILFIPPNKESKDYNDLINIAGFVKDYQQIDNKTTFYLCKDYTCQLPVTEIDEVKNALLNN